MRQRIEALVPDAQDMWAYIHAMRPVAAHGGRALGYARAFPYDAEDADRGQGMLKN